MLSAIFEIARLLFDSAKAYSEKKDVIKKRKFGQAIAACYFYLLDVTNTALEISGSIKNASKTNREEMLRLLHKQSITLIHLGRAMQVIEIELRLLDPNTSIRLALLVRGKKNFIRQLSNLLVNGQYPLAGELLNKGSNYLGQKTYDEITREIRERAASAGRANDEELIYSHTFDFYEDKYYEENFTSKVIDVRNLSGFKAYQNLSATIRLEELIECTENLRKIILDNFELVDILWSLTDFNYQAEPDTLA